MPGGYLADLLDPFDPFDPLPRRATAQANTKGASTVNRMEFAVGTREWLGVQMEWVSFNALYNHVGQGKCPFSPTSSRPQIVQ